MGINGTFLGVPLSPSITRHRIVSVSLRTVAPGRKDPRRNTLISFSFCGTAPRAVPHSRSRRPRNSTMNSFTVRESLGFGGQPRARERPSGSVVITKWVRGEIGLLGQSTSMARAGRTGLSGSRGVRALTMQVCDSHSLAPFDAVCGGDSWNFGLRLGPTEVPHSKRSAVLGLELP
jgi:hypothetical protein